MHISFYYVLGCSNSKICQNDTKFRFNIWQSDLKVLMPFWIKAVMVVEIYLSLFMLLSGAIPGLGHSVRPIMSGVIDITQVRLDEFGAQSLANHRQPITETTSMSVVLIIGQQIFGRLTCSSECGMGRCCGFQASVYLATSKVPFQTTRQLLFYMPNFSACCVPVPWATPAQE